MEAGCSLTAIKMKQDLNEFIEAPAGVSIQVHDRSVTVKGPKGEVSRSFIAPGVSISGDGKVVLSAKKATKREKAKLYATVAHIKGMIKGVQEPFVYVLKIFSGHFPMTVSISGNTFAVKNFLGEKVPRTTKIRAGVNVKVDGDKVTVTSVDKELAGMTASNIELLMSVSHRDRRIFQDGIFIIQKSEMSYE